MDERLKKVEEAKSEVAQLQKEADRERLAWQAATRHYEEVRGVGGSAR